MTMIRYGLFLAWVSFQVSAIPYIDRSWNDNDVSPEFVLREIHWSLAANSMSGSIEAEVEVSAHEHFNIRWQLAYEDQNGVFYFPAATSMGMDVYNIRYISGDSGKAFYSSHLIFHPVPPMPEIKVLLEISCTTYGPSLLQPVTASVYTGYYPQVQFITPSTLTPVYNPGSLVQYRPGQDGTQHLRYEVQASGSLDVSAYRLTPADATDRLADETLLDVISDREESLEVSASVSGENMQTTLDLRVSDLDRNDKRIYVIRFSDGDNKLYYQTPLLPAGTTSFWDAKEIRMELESCNPASDSSVVHARFDFRRGVPNCVRCRAASPALVSMEITGENMTPLGSSTTHAVYWYEDKPDVMVSEMVVFGYHYQSYSYAGRYVCTARARAGMVKQAGFEIRVL